MISSYSDCLSSKFIIIQGRTSNYTFVEGMTCSDFSECTQKICQIANNSMVDWTCFLMDSSKTEQIFYYNNNLLYLLCAIIIFLLICLVSISILLYFNRKKMSHINDLHHEKFNKTEHVNYSDTFNNDDDEL